MEHRTRSVRAALRYWYNSHLALVLESVFTGLAAGLVIAVFRVLLNGASAFRQRIYAALSALPLRYLLLWLAALAAAGLFLGWASAAFPMIRGSGIPQIRGSLLRKMSLNWRPELPLKIITGVLGIGAGLSLGREGPSIQIGAYVGKGVLTVFRRPLTERRFLILAASAAGVAGAFNAPLAALFFVVEEMGAQLSPLFLACAMGSAATADAAARLLGESVPVFGFASVTVLPLSCLHWVALLGAACGLLGALFKRALYASLDAYAALSARVPPPALPLIPLFASVPLAFFLPDALGGGQELIESLGIAPRALPLLALLFAAKLLFTALCYGSGVSGGIFLPFLSCGALAGAAMGEALALAGAVSAGQELNFLILGMAAFFTAVVGAPLTGMMLILEMTANFNHMGNLLVCCLAAFVTVNLMGSRPVYHVLLERITRESAGPPDPWI